MTLRFASSPRRPFRALAFLGFALFLLHFFQLLPFSGRRYDTWAWAPCPGISPFKQSCTASGTAIAHDVQIIVKTGGSEPQSRLRYQLRTILAGVPPQNILIFSDLEEEVESFHVHDIYADI